MVDLSGMDWDDGPPPETTRRIPDADIDSIVHPGRSGRTVGNTLGGGLFGLLAGALLGGAIGSSIDGGGSSGGLVDMPDLGGAAGMLIGAGGGLVIGSLIGMPTVYGNRLLPYTYHPSDPESRLELRRRCLYPPSARQSVPSFITSAPDWQRTHVAGIVRDE